MKKSDIENILVELLLSVQEMSGRSYMEIGLDTRPIGDLEEFDSLNGLEVTVALTDRLKMQIPSVNAFVNDEGTAALTVRQIANSIYNLTKVTN